ncbi:hypha-specific G1 cyclin-related protein 1-like, partial [Aphis craccivora]
KELKLKWKNIKDAYRKKCVHKSGQAAKSEKPYVYSNILEFLRPTMENRNTESNVAAVQNNDIDDTLDTDNEHDIAEEESPVQYKKKKIDKNQNNFEKQLISVLKERKVSEDPVTSFLMSLAPQIRKMTEDQQNQVYIEMIQVIHKVKTSNNFDQIQSQSIPQSINNSTSRPLQYTNSYQSYPTYPLNIQLPTTSYISNPSPTPSTDTNMPIYYDHRHQLHYPHTQSSAPTPEPPHTQTDTINSYYSHNTNLH